MLLDPSFIHRHRKIGIKPFWQIIILLNFKVSYYKSVHVIQSGLYVISNVVI